MASTVPPPATFTTVLTFSTLATVVAGLGSLPFLGSDRLPVRWIGRALALAAGFMLGVGYILMAEALSRPTLPVFVGAALGVAYTYVVHWSGGMDDLDVRPRPPVEGDDLDLEEAPRYLAMAAGHAGTEGVAIGCAMAVSPALGIFLTLALAVHNIAEGAVLTDVLTGRGLSLRRSAALSVLTKSPQLFLGVTVFVLLPTFDWPSAGALGFAAGSLVYLVVTELLPATYQRADKATIASLITAAAGGVVLLKSYFVDG